jgi:hypothetical protein
MLGRARYSKDCSPKPAPVANRLPQNLFSVPSSRRVLLCRKSNITERIKIYSEVDFIKIRSYLLQRLSLTETTIL